MDATDKVTERIVLKWTITHTLRDEQNEVTVIVRMTNPINPFMYLQAALSKSAEDIDNLEFEEGSMCVSVDGSGQTFAQEVFEQTGRWINSCPKPESMTRINERGLRGQV